MTMRHPLGAARAHPPGPALTGVRVRSAIRWAALALLVAALAVVPFTASATVVQYGIEALLLAALAQAWNILGGYAGYVSFGNSAFYGLGTYGTAIAMTRFHQPFVVGLAWGAVAGLIAAVLLGIPILRLRGPYFAIVTLGLSAVMQAIVQNVAITGKNIGLILSLYRNDVLFFELALALVIAATATTAWIARSRFGMGLVAIRESEDAANAMGVETTRFKVVALALSAVFTAVAGGIHAYWITFVDPASAFDPTLNVRTIIMAVFGGPGTVAGPLLGAIVLSGISEILSTTVSTAASIFYGLVIVAAVLFMPRGLIDAARGVRRSGWRYFTGNLKRYGL